MKLRHDKGQPTIVLEPGEVSAIEKVRGFLLSAAIHLEGQPSVGTLRDTARELGIVLEGSLWGLCLPKKRAKPEANGRQDAPGESHVTEPTQCGVCEEYLSPREAQGGNICRSCAAMAAGKAQP